MSDGKFEESDLDSFEVVQLEEFEQPEAPEPKRKRRLLLVVGIVVVALIGIIVLASGCEENTKPEKKDPEASQYPNQGKARQTDNDKERENRAGRKTQDSPGKRTRPVSRERSAGWDYTYSPRKPQSKTQINPIEKASKAVRKGVPVKYRDRPRMLAYWLAKKIRFPVRIDGEPSVKYLIAKPYVYVGQVSLTMVIEGEYPTIKYVKGWKPYTAADFRGTE